MTRYRDFDAFWTESQGEPLVVRVFGVEHHLPPAMPASVMIYVLRMQAEGADPDSALPVQAVLHLSEALFGVSRMQSWLDRGLTVDQLGDLIKWVMEQYQGGASPQGNRKAPAPAGA